MKTTNYILKAMENLQTNVALTNQVRHILLCKTADEEYDKISDTLADKGLPRPSVGLQDYMKAQEEFYNYLEELMLQIEKPF